jgi:outer membrane protein
MQLDSLTTALGRMAALILAGTLTTGTWAQESSSMPAAPSQAKATSQPAQAEPLIDYTKGRSHFPNPIGPYVGRDVPPPKLANTARIDSLLREGKLYLSMNDAISLALENNLDIAIARYNLNIADTDILRARAGAVTRGVNTGIVQGTIGGTGTGIGSTATGATGGGAGGTTTGSGGAGAGTSGLVTSTSGVGSSVPSFDPILTGTLQLDRNNSIAASAFANPTTSTNTSTVDFGYQQGFQWGTNLSVGFNNSRTTTSSNFTKLSPLLNSSFRATISQPLLQGFGFLPNTRFIRIAKNNREISDVAFKLQVITTVNQIQNIYWDLVNAYEDVKVKERSLALAQKTLSDNKKQVEIGTLAPIEVVRAQSEAATRQQDLITSQTTLELQQLLIKNALSRTLVDPLLADAEVIPTDTMAVPDQEPVTPVQDLVNQALAHRAELAESRIDLTNREITNKSAKNALLPTLNAFAYYGGTGQGGVQNPTNVCGNPGAPPFGCTDPSNIAPFVSYGGTVGQLFDSTAPDKGVGLQLNIPLRNRSAQADQVRALLEYRQAQMRLQQQENQIRIDVRNAQFTLQQNRARVEAARAGVELGRQSLDAETKKYSLGASTNTLVLQAQRDLAQSESTLVTALSLYEKSRVDLDRAIGATLDRLGIDVADAEQGAVRRMPNVPYVTPRPPEQLNPQMQQPQAQPNQVQPQVMPQTTPMQTQPAPSTPTEPSAQPTEPPPSSTTPPQ